MAFLMVLLIASEVLPFVAGAPGNGLVHSVARYAVGHCQRELAAERRLLEPREEDGPRAVDPPVQPAALIDLPKKKEDWHLM